MRTLIQRVPGACGLLALAALAVGCQASRGDRGETGPAGPAGRDGAIAGYQTVVDDSHREGSRGRTKTLTMLAPDGKWVLSGGYQLNLTDKDRSKISVLRDGPTDRDGNPLAAGEPAEAWRVFAMCDDENVTWGIMGWAICAEVAPE